MAKRSVDDILKETLPHKSKEDYLKAWKQFKEYIGEDRRPNEEDYIQYFDKFFSFFFNLPLWQKIFEDLFLRQGKAKTGERKATPESFLSLS